MVRKIVCHVLVLCGLCLVTTGLAAQTLVPSGTAAAETAPADPVSPEAVREMVSRLSDGEVRAMLLDRLDAVAEAGAAKIGEQGSVIDFVGRAASGAFGTIYEAVVRVPLLWQSQATSFRNFGDRYGAAGIGRMVGSLVLAILAGLAAELLVNRLTRRWHASALGMAAPQTLGQQLWFLFNRLCHSMYGLIAFFVVARLVGTSLVPPELHPFATIIMFNLVVMPRLGVAMIKFLLAPDRPEFRLLNVDDQTAKFLTRHQAGLVLLMGFSIAMVAFNDLNGVAMGTARLGFWLNLAVHVYIIYVAVRTWDGLVMMMRGHADDVGSTTERVAQFYPTFVIIVSVVVWLIVNVLVSFGLFDLLQTVPHYKTMFLLIMAPTLDTLVRGLVRHLAPPMTGEGVIAERAYLSTKRSYIRIGRVLMFGAVVLVIAGFWGINPSNLAAAGVGAQFAGRLIEIMMIVAIGYLVLEVVSLWINRKLAAEMTAAGFDLNEDEPGGGEGGGAGGSRLSTVLPLVLSCLKAAIVVVFALLALGNIGIDITPLLAGAGIIGLAIGFGAQKLVADVVSGIFFLVDDAFRTGEYVEIEGTMGTVEKISIRSMQLRHHKGAVHTIPYGEIPKITNYSRDWVIMKLKFTVPFETDPNKVKKIFKTIGAEMMAVPEFAEDMLQPFKSQGVFDFDDVGMIMRGKFMAKPGKQFTLRKEVYNRVKAAFAANGIDFARREVRVAIPGLEDASQLSEDDKAAIAGAATEAARQQVEGLGEGEEKK